MSELQEVLVTGGAGFIGANLCRALAETGRYRVTALDNLSTGYASNLDNVDATLVEGDILDHELLDRITPQGGVVVHLAALGSVPRSVVDPISTHEANAMGTLRVLEAARAADAKQVILASSSSVYGDLDVDAKHEDLPTSPKSPYGASKLAAEAYALSFQRSYGLGILAFRFFNVFGPLQAAGHAYAAVVPSFIDRAVQSESLVVQGDGTQSRDFTYVGTVAATIVDAIDRGVTFDGPVNLAFGTRISLLEVIDLMSDEFGRTLNVEHVAERPGDIRHSKADPTRLRELFPTIDPVNIEQGIKHTIDWFRASATD